MTKLFLQQMYQNVKSIQIISMDLQFWGRNSISSLIKPIPFRLTLRNSGLYIPCAGFVLTIFGYLIDLKNLRDMSPSLYSLGCSSTISDQLKICELLGSMQSKLRTFCLISLGIPWQPTSAPIIPPTIQALVSVSPPSYMVYLIESS